MEDIIISDEKEFAKLKERFKKDCSDKTHILADFDLTFTKAFVNGKIIPSLLSVLRDENYLTPDYSEKAKALYSKYHAIEIDPAAPEEEKKKSMEEWWNLHFDLLIKSSLSKGDIVKAMDSANLVLRDGAVDLLNFLRERNIPIVFLSSAGLGKESISIFLSQRNLLFDNMHIISNSFDWDENGKAIAVKKPIVHGMNKNETQIRNFPGIAEEIRDRKNILLLGDNPSDARMGEGFGYENILKIGFLNENAQQNLKSYKEAFDVVIANDSSMRFILDLMREMF